jgi:hypothetical protein
MGYRTDDYFSLPDDNIFDTNPDTVKVYLLNGVNYYQAT